MFTELEISVMDTLGKPNGNGELIDVDYGDYIELFYFEHDGNPIDNKILRGVLSSLIKKEMILIREAEFGKVVELTIKGSEYLKNRRDYAKYLSDRNCTR